MDQAKKIAVSTADLRPCTVDQMKALFHRWEDKSWIVPPSPMVGGHPGGEVRGVFAIVEMEDGSIREVEPAQVNFGDNHILFERHLLGKWHFDKEQDTPQEQPVECNKKMVWCVEKVYARSGVAYLSTCPICNNTVRCSIPPKTCPSCRTEFDGYFHMDTPWALNRFEKESENE